MNSSWHSLATNTKKGSEKWREEKGNISFEFRRKLERNHIAVYFVLLPQNPFIGQIILNTIPGMLSGSK
jgi:hypothetical protein